MPSLVLEGGLWSIVYKSHIKTGVVVSGGLRLFEEGGLLLIKVIMVSLEWVVSKVSLHQNNLFNALHWYLLSGLAVVISAL